MKDGEVWAWFAAAGLITVGDVEDNWLDAAATADDMLAEYRKRFGPRSRKPDSEDDQ
jgi:hypothetical protein